MSLATKHALRGYDAVQLAAALEASDERIADELSPLTLVSADNDLNIAAEAEGLSVENPRNPALPASVEEEEAGTGTRAEGFIYFHQANARYVL